MKSIKKSKKGDIPITILVIEVVALCALALGSFLVSGFNFEQKFYGLSSMQEMNVLIDDYYFYNNMGLPQDKIEDILSIQTNSLGRKYMEINQTSTEIIVTNALYGQGFKVDKFLFSVRYNFP